MTYATLEEYREFVGSATAAASDALLAAASRTVDELLIGAMYDVDDAGEPTSDTDKATLRDATCAQVQWLDEQGDTSGTGAAIEGGPLQSASIGSVSFSHAASSSGTSTSSRTLTASGNPVAPQTISILRIAGLLPVGPWVNG